MTSTSSATGCCVATLQRFTCWLPFLFCCASGDSSSNFCRLCFVLRFWNQTFTCGRTGETLTGARAGDLHLSTRSVGIVVRVDDGCRCVYPVCSLSDWGLAKTINAAVFVKEVAMATGVTIHAGKTRSCPNTSPSLTWTRRCVGRRAASGDTLNTGWSPPRDGRL